MKYLVSVSEKDGELEKKFDANFFNDPEEDHWFDHSSRWI